jgi:hypothetical protein
MTHHERLSLGVSTAALVISIISPFANYYWFQSEVRIRQLKAEAFRVEGNIYDCPRLQTILFDIVLKNTGVWPIDHVGLFIQKTMQTVALNQKDFKLTSFSFEKGDIQPEPALDVQIKEKKHEIVVHFQESLPPNSDVTRSPLREARRSSGGGESVPGLP